MKIYDDSLYCSECGREISVSTDKFLGHVCEECAKETMLWAIQAFIDAHPAWVGIKESLTIHQYEEWIYVSLYDLDIGRIKVDGQYILAEALWGYTKLGNTILPHATVIDRGSEV